MPVFRTGVAIVEDQRKIREGLRVLVDGTPGFRCTGAYGSMEGAFAAIRQAAPGNFRSYARARGSAHIGTLMSTRRAGTDFGTFEEESIPIKFLEPGLCTQSAFRALVPSADAGRG